MVERITETAPQIVVDAIQMQSGFVEGFALAGDYVKGLKDRTFEIVSEPRYEDVSDFKKPDLKKRKLAMDVKLADGQIIKYYPNNTSQKVIMATKGYLLAAWKGFKGEFYTADQMIDGKLRPVIYVRAAP